MSGSKRDVIDMRIRSNNSCRLCRNRDERKTYHENGLCTEAISALDSQQVRCVGAWAKEKTHWLYQYFGIFSKGMHKSWQGLNYIEICSGPGRCIIRDTGEEVDGTALAIINHPLFAHLSHGIFIDNNAKIVAILNERIKQISAADRAEAFLGDYQDINSILQILQRLPKKCLNLMFVDPTDCSVPFSTVEKAVAILENADLLINVSMGTDVSRNLARVILDESFRKTKGKYAAFLGDETFFSREDVVGAARANDIKRLRQLFAETYKARLRQYGYQYADIQPVRHYYYLLFASKNRKGLDFWNKACVYSPSGQKEFNFGM